MTKNRYAPTGEAIAKVNEHWGFAFDASGYERLEPSPAVHPVSGA